MSLTDPTHPPVPADGAPLLRVAGLRKSFGDNEVLRSIDLEVQRGQVVALIGPSGSGKTTVLRSLNGLETPDAGRVTVGTDLDLDFAEPLGQPPGRPSCATAARWSSSTTTSSRT